MELRLLSDQNLVATTDHATVAFLAEAKSFSKVVAEVKPAVVIGFETVATRQSNRDVLVCDWPGEYEKSEVSIISPSQGAYVLSLEGKTWLAIRDQDADSLDHDAEQLNSVEGIIIWFTNPDFKAAVQKLIDHLEPTHLVYVSGSQLYGAELLPPAPAAASEVVLKSSDWANTNEQVIAHTL